MEELFSSPVPPVCSWAPVYSMSPCFNSGLSNYQWSIGIAIPDLTKYYSAGSVWCWPYRANRPLTFQSYARSKVTSLIDRLKYTWGVTRDPSCNRELPVYQCNDCNGRFTTLQSLRVNMWSGRLCGVVKRKSCETCWILLGQLMTMHASFEVTVPLTLIVTNWAAERSFTSVY